MPPVSGSPVGQPAEASASQDGTAAEGAIDSAASTPDTVRRWTLCTLVLVIALLAWFVAADRFTPFTGQARVKAFVVPVAAQVAGKVAAVDVRSNQFVEHDAVLFRIDPEQYQLAIEGAKADLSAAEQELGASTAGLDSAMANLDAARAALVRSQRDADRLQRVFTEDPGAISQRRLDMAIASLRESEARVAGATAEVERARQQLGEPGERNARLVAARAALARAELDLSRTEIRAPGRGLVADVVVDVGNYAQPGQPQMTFIAIHDLWVEADLTENNLGHVAVGNPVEMVLDVQPGRVFSGRVRSVGWGVSTPGAAPGTLPDVSNNRDWLRPAQRFPVQIDLDPEAGSELPHRRVGAQVDVIVYTGDNWLLNAVGWCYIRLMGLLSYLY